MKNFALTGVAGYIAPKHLQAIKDTGNNLVAVMDPHDSVGILDRYFPNAHYFKEFERFERHLEKLRQNNEPDKIDYISICSPNYLHDAHIRLAFRIGANAVCEKPTVINPWNLYRLQELENETRQRVYTVLQLRTHPELIKLRERIIRSRINEKYDVELIYNAPRGVWYQYSWKGDEKKSGGILMNIGIHLFDLLIWLFGKVKQQSINSKTTQWVKGRLEFESARVHWSLSIVNNDPQNILNRGYRVLTINGEKINIHNDFNDLHTQIYKDILNGGGYGIDDIKQSIELIHNLRQLV